MLKSMLFAVALLAPLPAFAEDWVQLMESEDGSLFWYDRDSVRVEGGIASFWIKTKHTKVEPGEAIATRTLEQIDCAGSQIRLREMINLDAKDVELDRFSLDDQQTFWVPIEADTLAHIKQKTVCPKAG